MTAYYNELDPKAAAWLRELIRQGHIAPGEVDERDIRDVRPSDLKGFDQCHFFAGIGGWSLALRLARWPDDKPVWTGSCPCQPFSAAGRRKGDADERHLWPSWQWLIRECRPGAVFGEQVASKDGIAWLDTVSTDMEGEGYAFAPIVLPACGVGAPHIRQRTWFVAVSDRERLEGSGLQLLAGESLEARSADARSGKTRNVGNASLSGGGRDASTISGSQASCEIERLEPRDLAHVALSSGATHGFWSDAEWIACTDGKARPVEPGTFPLAHGIPARVGRLRGYGNAIVPEVAKEVIEAAMSMMFPDDTTAGEK